MGCITAWTATAGYGPLVLLQETETPRISTRWLGFITKVWIPLAIYLASRAYGFMALSAASENQIALEPPGVAGYYVHSGTPADPGYLAMTTNWDGQWYERIAVDGYEPAEAGPPTEYGASKASAFLPLFPMLVRGVMATTGLSFPLAAALFNLVLGGAAMVLLFRIVEARLGRFGAASTVALLCSFISAPLFQAAYSESLALLLLLGVLALMERRRYMWCSSLVVLLALTRLVTAPIAAVAVAHWWAIARTQDGWGLRWRLGAGPALVALTAVIGVPLWSTISSHLSGGHGLGSSRGSVSSLSERSIGWFSAAWYEAGWPGLLMIAVLAIALVRVPMLPPSRGWGTEMRSWFWAYPLYLLLAVPIHAGIFRYLLLAFPMFLLPVGTPVPGDGLQKYRALGVGVLVMVGVVSQWWWVNNAFAFFPDHWGIP
jgi:hypothetical protein